jgi:hypothetical protein
VQGKIFTAGIFRFFCFVKNKINKFKEINFPKIQIQIIYLLFFSLSYNIGSIPEKINLGRS